jgi:DNA-binding transcriptional regulator YiaG
MTAARRYQPNPARAAAIRRARDWAHMSQYDLARALDVSREAVKAWEIPVRDPGPAMTARIAVATRVPVSGLLAPVPAGARPVVRPAERQAA